MARATTAKEITARSESLMVLVRPITVAMAPGPNMIGMAKGMKDTSWLPLPALGIRLLAGEGAKSSKPIRIRITPPTTRIMLNGTSNRRNNRLPKMRKKNISSSA
ncbi:hypothetical protein D3C84_793360 [compost metagenome]